MNKILFAITFFLLNSAAFLQNAAEVAAENLPVNKTARYAVKILENKPKFAIVETRLPVSKGRLLMSPIGASHLPDGWATFVENLEVNDETGKRLNFEKKEGANWQIADDYNGTAHLSYRINLSFIYEDWITGNEQVGAYLEDSIYLVTRPIFITSDYDGEQQISFDVPAQWKISAPWKPTGNPKIFTAKNQTDLLSNTFVLGNQKEIRLLEGNFRLIFALPGRMKNSSEFVEATLKPVLKNYRRLFVQTPPTVFLMTFFYANAEDGEAYSSSSAFTTQDQVTKDGLIIWGNFLAHELFHFWNGQQMRGVNRDDRQWFSEGFTEYYANLTLIREKLISEDLFLKKMEKHLALYLFFKSSPALQGVSLVKAGERKGFYRPGVYNGGWTVAFCLDLLIREKTSGRKTLDDFFRAMHEKFGVTGKPYRYEDIVRTASETANTDLANFFENYVAGEQTIQVKEFLRKYGLAAYFKSYAGEFYIFKDPAATRNERELFERLISPTVQAALRK